MSDSIDLLFENLVIIDMGGGDAVGPLLDGIAARRIHIAHGHDLAGADLVGAIEQVLHAASGSDDSDAKSVVCAKHSG